MSQHSERIDHAEDDQQAERWVAMLRDGSPAEKAAARRGLAAIFEGRGLVAEAIDLLVANARAGHRDVETFQALSRLYRAQGDEYLAASAALEATRLSGRRAPAGPPPPRQAPWVEEGSARPDHPAADGGESDDAGSTSRAHSTDRPTSPGSAPSSWRRPARIVGWLAVVATLSAALIVANTSAVSAAIYLVSAVTLGLLLSGSLGIRRLIRLPDGPLGDGTLLFGWLLLLLVAGATVPRTGDTFVNPRSTSPIPTPGLYRTPPPSPGP